MGSKKASSVVFSAFLSLLEKVDNSFSDNFLLGA